MSLYFEFHLLRLRNFEGFTYLIKSELYVGYLRNQLFDDVVLELQV